MAQPYLIEVTNEAGEPTGEFATIDEAIAKGNWYRAAHVVIYTSDGQILIQKRSKASMRYPNLLDISVGAVIHPSKTPDQTVVERVYEELGIKIDLANLTYIGTTQTRHSPIFYEEDADRRANSELGGAILHNYIIELPSTNITLHYLKNEVAWAGFIKLDWAKQLVATGNLESIGKLMPRYEYYQHFLTAIEKKLVPKAARA